MRIFVIVFLLCGCTQVSIVVNGDVYVNVSDNGIKTETIK
jgi:hypothetical protein